MVNKRLITTGLIVISLLSAAVVSYEGLSLRQHQGYNKAIRAGDYLAASKFLGDHGAFALAYSEQQNGRYQQARVIYDQLEHSEHKQVQLNALYNLGNTYLEQALSVDMETDADIALPLIELAKVSYRDALRLDPNHWDARYNLERALTLTPDVGELEVMDIKGRPGAIRTIITADPEGGLP